MDNAASGDLRAALNAGAAALRKHRPGKTGERQAALLEEYARELKADDALAKFHASLDKLPPVTSEDDPEAECTFTDGEAT